MGCIWRERSGGTWEPRSLPVQGVLSLEEAGLAGTAILLSARNTALLVRPGVRARVNGEPVLGGLRLLEHRDEILLGPVRLYFSAQTAPVRVAFHLRDGERPPVCPLCRGPVREGMQAVQCPGCSRWFHQLDATAEAAARPCWTYAPTCRFCNHPTPFDADAAWRPGREESLDGSPA